MRASNSSACSREHSSLSEAIAEVVHTVNDGAHRICNACKVVATMLESSQSDYIRPLYSPYSGLAVPTKTSAALLQSEWQ